MSLSWMEPSDVERFKRQPIERIVGLRGIRWWRVGIDRESLEPILVSTYRTEHAWRGPVLVSDRNPIDYALEDMPSHGIYVVKPRTPFARNMHCSCKTEVAGVVEIIGPTVEHERAYRAAKVIVRTLILPMCHYCPTTPDYLCFDLSGNNSRTAVYPPPNWLDADITQESLCPMHLVADAKWTCVDHGPTSEDGINVPDLVKLWERRYECEIVEAAKLLELL